MKKVRLNLLVALIVTFASLAALAFGTVHFGGWERWACAGGIAVVGIFALALAVVLAISFLTTTGDLWDTWWFRAMRELWGDAFGGPGTITDPETKEMSPRPLQISICKAVNMSAIVILLVPFATILVLGLISLVIGAMGFFAHLTVVSAWNGVEEGFLLFSADQTQAQNLGWFLFLVGVIFQAIVAYACATLISIAPAKLKGGAWKVFASIFTLTSILIFVVTPMQTLGIGEVLKWIGIVLGSIAGLALTIAFPILSISGIIRGSKKLSGETVAGVLLRGRIKAWKKRLCPPIIQDEKFAV